MQPKVHTKLTTQTNQICKHHELLESKNNKTNINTPPRTQVKPCLSYHPKQPQAQIPQASEHQQSLDQLVQLLALTDQLAPPAMLMEQLALTDQLLALTDQLLAMLMEHQVTK